MDHLACTSSACPFCNLQAGTTASTTVIIVTGTPPGLPDEPPGECVEEPEPIANLRHYNRRGFVFDRHNQQHQLLARQLRRRQRAQRAESKRERARNKLHRRQAKQQRGKYD